MLNKPRAEIQSPLSLDTISQIDVCVCVWTAALSFCVFKKKSQQGEKNKTSQ